MMKAALFTLLTAFFASAGAADADSTAPIPVKVVVVTMFETGADTGDKAGEFQRWYERMPLDTRFPAPHMHHDIHMNLESGVLGIVTGMGTANAAASVMALGLDPRFDLSQAYWLVAGISGFDPADASLGSVAWAEWLVDGDLAHEIDSREIPEGWNHGYFPLFSQGPEDASRKSYNLGEVFRLNTGLVDWAYGLTRDMPLPDHPTLEAARKPYVDYPVGQQPPRVIKGDQLAAMTFWHGELLNDWANEWVKYWTDGQGEFVSSAMEDTGTFQSLTYLDAAGKVDKERVMVLRTASNFTLPPPGKTAAAYLLEEQHDSYAGLDAALENAYQVGRKVIDTLLADWEQHARQIPAAN